MTADGINGDTQAPALKIFIGGDRSQVGKSTVCLGILGSLLELGYSPSDLAYIKPVTQCEQPQLISKWCAAKGVACRGIGPVVFYAGFTRAFLKGEAGTSEQLLADAKAAVDEISKGKKFVVVDGVGYPAVGSICGISNAHTAAALHTPVLLVGRSGVGDAVDSFNLNATFFKSHGVEVLGGVFNRLASGGFYSLANCQEAVTNYFARVGRQMPYGFVPDAQPMLKGKLEVAAAHTDEALSAAVAVRGGGLVLVVFAQPECPVPEACKVRAGAVCLWLCLCTYIHTG
ncbi:AAA domain-containing protein [Tribonema minus]|uniref:AAA domain-containing protein n=1 Tax=Tribonema minus TaxID=303371 RepID=A0A836CIE2_9STRA|nr:AAA domain-containing protein [Tribonema minus]